MNKKKKTKKNNRNKFTQHSDSKDKENVSANKKKFEKKFNENTYKRKYNFEQIMNNFMITLVAGVIVWIISFNINRYFLSPRHIDISTSQYGLVGHVNIDQHDKECKIYFIDSDHNLEINLDNNSDMFMNITDICVNVIKCTDITEEDIEIGECVYGGDAKRPIVLKTKIEHHTGKMETEIDRKHNPEYDTIPYSYIQIIGNTGEKFILSMDFEKQGYYNIEVEFSYMYDGKTQTIKTNSFNCIFIEKNMKDIQLLD